MESMNRTTAMVQWALDRRATLGDVGAWQHAVAEFTGRIAPSSQRLAHKIYARMIVKER